MKIYELEKILEKVWAKETSIEPEKWTKENPSLGQCVPTSLIVNDYIGGEIVWALAKLPDGQEISHYFNKINGNEIDLTRKQFPAGTQIAEGKERKKNYQNTRDYLMSNEDVVNRYLRLNQNIGAYGNLVLKGEQNGNY